MTDERVMMQDGNTKSCGTVEIRAEELIVNIYRDKLSLQKKGRQPKRVVMPMELYRKIRNYHAGLGEIQGQYGDYITEDEIFGMTVYIDNVDGITVE